MATATLTHPRARRRNTTAPGGRRMRPHVPHTHPDVPGVCGTCGIPLTALTNDRHVTLDQYLDLLVNDTRPDSAMIAANDRTPGG
jgi:ribosomal protein L34E